MGLVAETAREAADRFADATAFVAPSGWELSFTELDRLADEVAAGLLDRGVRPGDVVALVLPNLPEYPIAYVAADRIGAVTAGINPRLSPRERAACLAVARPRLVLATAQLRPSVVDSGEWVEVTPATAADHVLAELRPSRPADSLRAESVPNRRTTDDATESVPNRRMKDVEDPVAIVFTSGTTGDPKGAWFADRQFAAVTRANVGDGWGRALGSHSLVTAPMAHVGFMLRTPGNLREGGTQHIVDRWRPADALRFVAEHRSPVLAGVPTQLAMMLRHADFDATDLSSVRAIVVGGGPVTAGLAAEARARVKAPISVRYSCTEIGSLGFGTDLEAPDEDALVSVGRPRGDARVSIRRLDDPAVEVEPTADGESHGVGEVCINSPAAMSGYWNNPEATANAFTPDRYVRTGDLGWIDPDGRLRLVGRSKEMYVRAGYNVYPAEVETIVSTHPKVAAVAIVPVDDDVLGERGIAVVVPIDPHDPPTVDELRRAAATELASYKLPDDIHLVDALPLTAMEKVDRRALRSLVADPTAQLEDS